MNQTEYTLRSQTIQLALKALDIAAKTLSLIGQAEDSESTETLENLENVEASTNSGAPENSVTSDAPTNPETSDVPEIPVVLEAPANSEDPVTPEIPVASDSPHTSPSNYRAEAIRFNEQFLRERYELRYNTMKKTTEMRPRHPDAEPADWRPVSDRDLNALTVEQLLAGGQSWGYGIRLCVDSSRVAAFDPVGHYLDHLPRWDGRDHIGALAARVPTAYDAWPCLFRRWLLAMVAQARGLSADHGNALVPLLIGRQGTGKTTFCRMLLPRHLRQYFMDDIKMDSAEQVERVLGRMWLVNIDEYDSKTQREQAKIKRLLTERDVQVRRPHSDQYTLVRRTCSFIATTNDDRPLTDATGSRRYLCVELTGAIDTTSPLNHDQLFAQALHLLSQGEPFHLTCQEEAQMEAHNRRYCRRMVLADAVSAALQPAATGPDTLMTTADILDALCDGGLRPQDMPTPRQLVAALRTAGIRQGAQQGRRGWYARRTGEG